MNLDIIEVRVSIDHITLTSDERNLITFHPSVLGHYRYLPRIPTNKDEDERHISRTYKYFHPFQHENTGNKVHIYVDRFNTESYKTLFAPNITVKFFSSWDHPLTYEEVAGVHNRLVEKYNVYFNLPEFHVAVDLFFFNCGENPIRHLVGRTLSGRKMSPALSSQYPNTWLFHSGSSRFCLIAYDKSEQLFANLPCVNKT